MSLRFTNIDYQTYSKKILKFCRFVSPACFTLFNKQSFYLAIIIIITIDSDARCI